MVWCGLLAKFQFEWVLSMNKQSSDRIDAVILTAFVGGGHDQGGAGNFLKKETLLPVLPEQGLPHPSSPSRNLT